MVIFKMLKTSMNHGMTRCVFIDFSCAFDCIDHRILLPNLKLYGLDNKAIQFISSYFNSRYQATVIDGNISNTEKVMYGTPQGLIRGPLTFIIYVNDLFHEIRDKTNIIMYADDTLLMLE